MIYDRITVSYDAEGNRPAHFENALTDEEIRDGVEGYERFPSLVENLTAGAAHVETTVIHAARPLETLTPLRAHQFWPSPDDTRNEFAAANAQNKFHSFFVFWPQNNFRKATSIPSGGWGLGMGASAWSDHATYATVANAPTWAWQRPMVGEVWLHEWLHGVCAHFAVRGHRMPARDADGGGLHGYVQSPVSGWTDYYRDLMTGHVSEGGELLGIPADAWRSALA